MPSSETVTANALVEFISQALERVWGFSADQGAVINLHEPTLTSKDADTVLECIQSSMVSSVGGFSERFAKDLAAFAGVEFAVPVVNGTSALQLALYVAGVRAGDDVAVPSLSFIATANAVRFLGATPVFVDSSPCGDGSDLSMSVESLGALIDAFYVEEGDQLKNRLSGARLAAIVPMHTLGRIADMSAINTLAKSYNIPVVEDAAEALGSTIKGSHPGSENLAVLSFNGNKIITTGGGGAVLTNSSSLFDKLTSMSTTSKIPHTWRFSHSDAGWNFRLPALNAALGCSQLEQLPAILDRKRNLYEEYQKSFVDSPWLNFISTPIGQQSNHWLNALQLTGQAVGMLDDVLDQLNGRGIRVRPMWDLISEQAPYLGSVSTDLPRAKHIRASLICLPSSPSLFPPRR